MNTPTKLLFATIAVLLAVSARAQVPRLLDPPIFAVDGYGTGSLIAADFNGDGLPDVAAGAYFGGSTMDILLSNGDGTFRTLSDFPAGISPTDPAAGDLNGDGVLDLVVPDYGNSFGTNNQLRVFLGNGDGTFGPGQLYHLSGNHPDAAAVGDFNGDGKLDVVVAVAQSSTPANAGIVQVLLGNGDGTLQTAVSYPTANGPGRVAVADLDGDGALDLVVGTSSGVSVLFGQGDGTFQSRKDYTLAGGANDLTLADINHDGKLDVAATTSVDLSVLLNTGDGTFASAISTPIERGAGNIVAGDLDQDGVVDLVVSHGLTSIYFGNGDGTFRAPVGYAPVGGVAAIANFDAKPGLDLMVNGASFTIGGLGFLSNQGNGTFLAPRAYFDYEEVNVTTKDLNDDGKPDLIAVTGEGAVSVFLNDGIGQFPNRVNYEVGGSPRAAVAADLDGDGKEDVAVGNQFDNTVSILLGNGDGTLQPAISYPGGKNGPQVIAAADFNGDGAQDLVTSNAAPPPGGTLSVLLSMGGAFPKHTDLTVATSPTNVITADFNGDGKPDIAVAYENYSQAINAGLISVFISKGDGTFQPRVDYPLDPAFDVVLVTAGDVNGDGHLDLVAARSLGATATLLGNGDGTFQAPINSPSAMIYPFVFPSGILLADLNGDGLLDLVLVSGVSVLYGNADGTFQAPQYYSSFGSISSKSVVAADFNGDGAVDIGSDAGAQVVAVLSNTGGSQVKTISSKNPAQVGQKIIFTSRVTPTFPVGTPTGTVTFFDGTFSLGTATLVNGQAKLAVSTLAAGRHLIQAHYNGDATFVPNQSKVNKQVVNP